MNNFGERWYAWAAGLFDGEGCITNDRGRIVLQLGNTDPKVLLLMKGIFGGIIQKGRGESSNDFSYGIKTRQQFFQWRLTGNRSVEEALSILKEYLVSKKEEAEFALFYLKRYPHGVLNKETLPQEQKEMIQKLALLKTGKLDRFIQEIGEERLEEEMGCKVH